MSGKSPNSMNTSSILRRRQRRHLKLKFEAYIRLEIRTGWRLNRLFEFASNGLVSQLQVGSAHSPESMRVPTQYAWDQFCPTFGDHVLHGSHEEIRIQTQEIVFFHG